MLFFSSIVFVHCCSVVPLIFLNVTRIVKIRFFLLPFICIYPLQPCNWKAKKLYTMRLHSLYTMCFHCCILCPFTVVYYVPSLLYTMFLHRCIPCVFTACILCVFTFVYPVPSQLYTMSLHRSGRAFFYTLEFKEIIRRITLFYGKLRK